MTTSTPMEKLAGLVLGWNFGDGHLHNERLLDIVQQQCHFAEGDLRCIFVESQPLWGSHQMAHRRHSGVLKQAVIRFVISWNASLGPSISEKHFNRKSERRADFTGEYCAPSEMTM